MMLQQILFFVFGAVVLVAAIGVVAARKVFHAALWLLLAFFGVAGLYVLLEAPFFAAAQLFVYMGAIGILIIFAIMLTESMMSEKRAAVNETWGLAIFVAALFLLVMAYATLQAPFSGAAPPALVEDSLPLLGRTFVSPSGFVLPFEVASILLVAALIGAVTIARE